MTNNLFTKFSIYVTPIKYAFDKILKNYTKYIITKLYKISQQVLYQAQN